MANNTRHFSTEFWDYHLKCQEFCEKQKQKNDAILGQTLMCCSQLHISFDYKLDVPKCHTSTRGLWGHVCRNIRFLLTLTCLLCKTSEGQKLLKRYERNKNSKVCPTPGLPCRDWKCSRGCFRTNFTGRVHGNEEICHPVRQDDSFMCF